MFIPPLDEERSTFTCIIATSADKVTSCAMKITDRCHYSFVGKTMEILLEKADQIPRTAPAQKPINGVQLG